MKKILLLIILFCSFQPVFAATFGQYNTQNYMGLAQQLQAQRMNAIRRQRAYNVSHTRNIKYPTFNNPYPNITTNNNTQQLSARQRYSAKYYDSL